ncbi:16S rRNA methyltransferase [Paenibacillus swuensis]|uniref:16S rRNA methyltransferase n=1 Tax=Paenibacillus swuensis TaxID=1178515 RepID=A0A172TIP5_9BACL|nr:class I SAM-dependent methyltransferase [Paenibacillus swuensis]ANE46774.1 16S rRNA methyltransferase [Paenibacillus swuensis]
MSEHYYTNKPSTVHKRHTIEQELVGRKFTFVTDSGVFSKTGVDYGSKVLIQHMSIPEHAEVLDVGCGYGPIGLAAATLASAGRVTMVDINERAVELAKENATRNGISNVDIMQSDALESLQGRTFDIILTNPPIRAGKDVVHSIFEQSANHLKPGGQLWVVIQKKQGAPSALSKLEDLFSNVEEKAKDKGYRIFCAKKAD